MISRVQCVSQKCLCQTKFVYRNSLARGRKRFFLRRSRHGWRVQRAFQKHLLPAITSDRLTGGKEYKTCSDTNKKSLRRRFKEFIRSDHKIRIIKIRNGLNGIAKHYRAAVTFSIMKNRKNTQSHLSRSPVYNRLWTLLSKVFIDVLSVNGLSPDFRRVIACVRFRANHRPLPSGPASSERRLDFQKKKKKKL